MTFLNSNGLLLLLIMPLAALIITWRHRIRSATFRNIGDPLLVATLVRGASKTRRRIKSLLWLMTAGSLIIALARPAWGIGEEIVEANGLAIVVVLDVSLSMDAQDVLPSRLERAKLAARDLYSIGEGNQLGLILFAGSAFVQFPLTSDAQAAMTFLDSASSASISRQGTALADALGLANAIIDDRIIANSIVVVLSDGENHEGDPRQVAEIASERGIVIHAIGYGDPVNGGPIPIDTRNPLDDPYKTDAQGNLVVTKLQPEVLRTIATATGGSYQTATDSGVEIVNLVNAIREVEDGLLTRQSQIRRIERFSLFAVMALITLSLEMYLRDGSREDRNENS